MRYLMDNGYLEGTSWANYGAGRRSDDGLNPATTE